MAKNLQALQKRTYFTQSDDVINPPNLVKHQNQSFKWFVEEGLGELLAEISPIDE
jgi:DNA-directed RNA polymerase subunit beta